MKICLGYNRRQLSQYSGQGVQGQAGAVVLNYGVQEEQCGEPQSPLVIPQEGGENRHAVSDAAKINAARKTQWR